MIVNFRHKGLELFFTKNNKKLLNAKDIKKITRLLDRLDAAEQIGDMDIPGFGLHQLTGDKKGYWSVTVSANWRITFRFEGTNAYEINLEDYH